MDIETYFSLPAPATIWPKGEKRTTLKDRVSSAMAQFITRVNASASRVDMPVATVLNKYLNNHLHHH